MVGVMGRQGRRNAVVDSTGKVFGVRRLRVVDASIFALLPPGHPQATNWKINDLVDREHLADSETQICLQEKIADDIVHGR